EGKVRGFTHQADASERRGTRALHDSLTESFKRIARNPELLASIGRRGF
ncbi:hypothetical protein FHS54_003334, partial [Sphingobium vermicomposti]|nr:hypothetical protein [Sphingobium vermicomposti]